MQSVTRANYIPTWKHTLHTQSKASHLHGITWYPICAYIAVSHLRIAVSYLCTAVSYMRIHSSILQCTGTYSVVVSHLHITLINSLNRLASIHTHSLLASFFESLGQLHSSVSPIISQFYHAVMHAYMHLCMSAANGSSCLTGYTLGMAIFKRKLQLQGTYLHTHLHVPCICGSIHLLPGSFSSNKYNRPQISTFLVDELNAGQYTTS